MMATLIKEKPLSHYLRHPHALREVDKAELKSLSSTYPYNPHLHILIALKDHLEHGRVNRELLEKAALYISDQRKLGEWVKKLQKFAGNWEQDIDRQTEAKPELEKSKQEIEEQVFWPEAPEETDIHKDSPAIAEEDLKPKLKLVQSNIPREPEADEVIPEADDLVPEETGVDHTEDVENIIEITEELIKEHALDEAREKKEPSQIIPLSKEEEEEEEEDILPDLKSKTKAPDKRLPEQIEKQKKKPKVPKRKVRKEQKEGDLFKRLVKGYKKEKEDAGDKEREEVSPFLKWLQSLGNTPSEGYHDLEVEMQKLSKEENSRKKKKKKKKKKKEKPELFENSLREDEGIVSEALADLLSRQGHTERAIEMYEKLRLIIPEKSPFFAQKISELKK